MNSSNIALFSITNAVGGYIAHKFGIESIHASGIGMFLLYIFEGFKFETWHLLSISIMCIGWYIYNNGITFGKAQTSSIKLCNFDDINQIQTYMKKYKHFFDKYYDTILGNLDAVSNTNPDINIFSKLKFLEAGQKIPFNDLNFNITGFIEVFTYNKEITDTTTKNTSTIEIKYPIIHIYKNSCMRADSYYNKIKKRNIKDHEEEDNIKLYYTKVICKKNASSSDYADMYNHRLIFYDGPKNNLDERKRECMDTFFHQQKNYLLSFINKIQNQPDFFTQVGQNGQLNMILHGPPGTGKSTFVYRLAKSTNRHIISVDLNNVTFKKDAYQIIQDPFNEDMKPSEYIILLEEFDNVILNLNTKEKKIEKKIKNKNDKNDKNDEHTAELNMGDFELNDLLEILQGPVPREGQIIIATTNKFNEIKEICPALFRPGRLTPIEFGYMTCKEVDELSKIYFGHKVDIKFDPKIPTSKIIEIALYAKLINDPDYFVREMNKNK